MSDGDIPKRATMTELVSIADTSDVTLRKHIRKASIPKGKDGKYNVQKVLSAMLEHRKDDNRNIPDGALMKIRATKGALECQILQVKLDILKGEYISMDDHLREVSQLIGVARAVFIQIIEDAKATDLGAAAVKRARSLMDKGLDLMRAGIEQLDED